MRLLCQLTDIPDGQARSFPLDEKQSLLVVRRGLRAWAYINRCPHAGVPLEWEADRFMSLDGSQLQCSLHGALFKNEQDVHLFERLVAMARQGR